ncbi:hypothetical protein JRQ81_017015 [Phrynocephalus forsythii]|uniref:Small ribosomal subunit protein mS26 n=1 Tax=Phrynocephalus forsythii TaxID=171643 RepID=A0A9Q0XTD0_9SAUR|nr:hypothetical protein JRQ81_017015 [Phrynocephalus forsythii]
MLPSLAAWSGRASSSSVLLNLRGCPRPPSSPALLVVPSRGRKSRHDPPAQSKAGRINRPPPVDPAELLVIRHRKERHHQIFVALRSEFAHEVWKQRNNEFLKILKEKEEEEHRQLMAWNDAENKRLQAKREERLLQEEIAERERRLLAAEHLAASKNEFMKEREKEVLQLQEEAKYFITLENLDERIEECLDNLKNYNFAIDKEGRVAKRSVLP